MKDGNTGVHYRYFVSSIQITRRQPDVATACSEVVPVQSIYSPIDKETGRPRGFGFEEAADEIQADRLMAQLNRQALQGRELVVHPARPREDHPQRSRDTHPSHGSAGRSGNHSRHGRPVARPYSR